ncbi:MAG: sigma 54-interacting transcriptional regulator [Dehalococcoidia bacterium]|nr:sigma 54-interacting transcriptional regulator [Dehalococcoidia bacterium]
MAVRQVQSILAKAHAELAQGRGTEVARTLARELARGSIRRKDELALRSALAEAWLLEGDTTKAAAALGEPPRPADRDRLEPGLLSTLWRLHGRVAAALGEQSRAIGLLGRALTLADRGYDTRAIGLAHYELALCYTTLGNAATVLEHLSQAADALRAADDRRNLALVRSLIGVSMAQDDRFDEALEALEQAERIASSAQADDVVAIISGNQANVALMRHQHERALALAERSVTLHERSGAHHGLGVALATLGQICIRLGDLSRARQVLTRALKTRSAYHFHETTGAVYDSLAQIHLIQGEYDQVEAYLKQAWEAYGDRSPKASRWYAWSLYVLDATLALRRGQNEEAFNKAIEIGRTSGVPAHDAVQAELVAAEALLVAGRTDEAEQRLADVAARLDRGSMIGEWGQYLRLRGQLGVELDRGSVAYHDLSQSVTVFELTGDRYHAGLSRLALGRLAGRAGATGKAARYLEMAAEQFDALGAGALVAETRRVQADLTTTDGGDDIGAHLDNDDVLVRRLIDAALLPALLSRETVATLVDSCDAETGVLYVQPPEGDPEIVATAGLNGEAVLRLARTAGDPGIKRRQTLLVDTVGARDDHPLRVALSNASPFSEAIVQRFRTMVLIARQGFELCAMRQRPVRAPAPPGDHTLDTQLPGFIHSSAAMTQVVEQIRRLHENDLTVLITGESGTGKELIAQAIHVGSPRSSVMFLPYNCTATTTELADSQLFGHRRGSFTGAVADQPGVIRSVDGGTLFLDEIGDLPLDIQPKLLRFLEQGEILPVGETRPQRVDVRVIAATNADLEQRVAHGRFREDLFYRLGVIRIHVPPLRDRREEIPHLTTFFLREAIERFAKPGVELSAETVEVFANFGWPGNIRQLRNEIQRVVALSTAGTVIGIDQLSPELSRVAPATGDHPRRRALDRSVTLAAAVEHLERELIGNALDGCDGNISETARVLGLTRRGLYLKLRRLGMESRPTV